MCRTLVVMALLLTGIVLAVLLRAPRSVAVLPAASDSALPRSFGHPTRYGTVSAHLKALSLILALYESSQVFSPPSLPTLFPVSPHFFEASIPLNVHALMTLRS